MIAVLNVGLKNARCIVYSMNGKILSNYSKSIKTELGSYFVEQNLDLITNLSNQVISKAINKLKNKSKQIKYYSK